MIRRIWFFFASDAAKRQRAYRDLTEKYPDADPALIARMVGL